MLRRYLIHPVEAAVAYAFYGLLALLPLEAASAFGGSLTRAIGPRLAVSRRAVRNLKIAFPDITPEETRRIVVAMWENLGRIAGEYPHLGEFLTDEGRRRVDIVGREHLEPFIGNGKPAIFVSGHIGNWEVFPPMLAGLGLPLGVVYRAANNRLIDWLYSRGRAAGAAFQIPKGPKGARKLIALLQEGRRIAMLVDQKMNDGIAVPFFGRPAMTASAAADLSLRYGCALIPSRIERIGATRFRITILPPLEHPDTGDRRQDALLMMTRVNALLEGWIRERPEQWLWLHNRWPESTEP